MRRLRIWAGALCALLCAGLLTTAALAVAEPTEAFYVADYADVLSEDTERYIVEQNESLFQATGGQIVVVAVDFMDGMSSGDYAMAVAENWGGIGDAERDNGFLLVYAVGENKVWAMAGAGIEDALPASRIETYLEDCFYGGYDAGAYDQATRDFFDAILGWYEGYYGLSAAGGAQGGGAYPEGEQKFLYYPESHGSGVIVTAVGVTAGAVVILIVVAAIVVIVAADGARYRRYRRRYLMPGMPPPPYVYRPFLFGRPHHHHRPPRPPRGPRPPMGGGFHGGGSFRGGGAGRGGGFGGFGGGSFGGGFRGGGFGGGGGFRGGGAGRG